jgi:phosphoribosyl 1,2-cyclic phosphate phosphodiesterase
LIITFLGTGTSQGVPVIACECSVCRSDDPCDKRLRSSVMITVDNKNIVIDSGPDFRQQMLREKVKRLDALVFTHEHKDHVAGMDDIRAFNFSQKEKVNIYATKRVEEALRREYVYIFNGDNYPGIPQIKLYNITNIPFEAAGIKFIPIEVSHFNLPVLGFRVGDFSYVTDANYISDKEKDKIIGSKVIVINALRKQEHVSHFTLDEAVKLMEEFKPEKAYLTHISHQLGRHADVNKELPAYIQCGFDGLRVEI